MDGMNISEVLNVLLGGGLVATIVAICTLRATIRKAKAESMKAEADAETVRMDNAEHATRILVENIVKPLKEELNETRRYLEASKREMARLRKAIDTANSCKHHDDCPVLVGLRDKPKSERGHGGKRETSIRGHLQSEVRQTWTETVPQEEAKLEIPLAELTNLPEKAEYRAKNGRASATVQNKGGTIVVYATCDSLQRQCEYYERQMASYKKALEQQKNEARTEKERSSNPWKMLLIAFIVGVATGTVLTIITKRIWQKVRNSCTA